MDNAITTCNGKVPNRFYYPEFVRTFRKIFVSIAPLWTCLLLGIFLTLSTNTAASISNKYYNRWSRKTWNRKSVCRFSQELYQMLWNESSGARHVNGDRVAISQLLDLQNYTRNNRTQGIIEKSQKNLKTWRHGKIYARLDDFVNFLFFMVYYCVLIISWN